MKQRLSKQKLLIFSGFPFTTVVTASWVISWRDLAPSINDSYSTGVYWDFLDFGCPLDLRTLC